MRESEPLELDEAHEEALELRQKINSGEASSYTEAEEKLSDEAIEKLGSTLTSEQLNVLAHNIKNASTNDVLKLNLSEEVIQMPEVQDAIIFRIRLGLTKSLIDKALEIKHKFNLSDEVIRSDEVQNSAKSRLLIDIQKYDGIEALKIINEFLLPDEIALQQIGELLAANDFEKAKKIIDNLQPLTERLLGVVCGRLKDLIISSQQGESPETENDVLMMALQEEDYKKSTGQLIQVFSLSPEIVKYSAENAFLGALENGNVRAADEIKSSYNLDLDTNNANIRDAAVAGFKECLKGHHMSAMKKFIDQQYLTNEVFDLADVRSATKESLTTLLTNKIANYSWELEEFLSFKIPVEVTSDPSVSECFRTWIKSEFSEGNFPVIISVTEKMSPPIELLNEIDEEMVSSVTVGSLIKFIPSLGSNDLFPLAFEKVHELLFSELETNIDVADYFIEKLKKYIHQTWAEDGVKKAIKHYSVAKKFFDEFGLLATTENLYEPWIPHIIEEAAKLHGDLSDHDSDFEDNNGVYSHNNEGFSETDPYENHPWVFGPNQAKLSSLLSSAINGDLPAIKELDEKVGIDFEKVNLALSEVYDKINLSYKNFIESIHSNPNIKDDDKQALLDPTSFEVRMTPLLNNVRSFAARYLVQSVEGDVTRLSEISNLSEELDRILAEGFRRYVKVHEVDIPLYDKLYEEFDNLRETGRYPLEVYLGRDGIYAYVGRRAEDVARRRKMGLEGRKQQRESGEVLEINPQYTVYPRYFRDNINYETKRKFLEQEGISPDADPLFYDTGYKGTVPEQIMRVMEFDEEDIEQRIRLLSAPSIHRRVKGIPENARNEVVEYIEHNAKTEDTAEGLIIDEETGRIRHIAQPTTPEEQFYFMMVKQAIERHYWLQEQLHHEPSGNVNLDSEHFTIRIRQDYAKLLPQDFLDDPKAFFTKQGELLKGSKGEGAYPDEEIVLFELKDGTEIIAKRIELRKAKEAKKEFSILIAAKKAGLPTAEPVGFLSGKEETDGSYLLMKKLEGRSGRKFEKELVESGKYSDQQIVNIMQEVAQKNVEMAEIFRQELGIDKRWRIKDTIIEFDEEAGEVRKVIPIDWERAESFDPEDPKKID